MLRIKHEIGHQSAITQAIFVSICTSNRE